MGGDNTQSVASPITTIHWGAIGLVVVTGLVHLVLGIGFLPHWMGVVFVLAALGFFGAIVLFWLDVHRRLLYLAGIPYTGVQIVLWYALNQPTTVGDLTPVEVIDKVAQVLLIVTLIVLYRRES